MPDCSVAQISDYLISVYKCQNSDSTVNGLIGFDTYFTANALFKKSDTKSMKEKVEVDVKLEELDTLKTYLSEFFPLAQTYDFEIHNETKPETIEISPQTMAKIKMYTKAYAYKYKYEF